MILFSKMEGLGNDFIIVNCITQYFSYSLNSFSKYLCNRNFGVGADGVIYVFKSYSCDCKIRIFNSDGTEAESCGNGIRCVGKYLYEKGIVNREKVKIETKSGIKDVELIIENKTVINVKVNMGKPIFEPRRIPVYLPKDEIKNVHSILIKIENEEYEFFVVSMGNPHAVCFVDNLDKVNVSKLGNIVENYKYFPNKTNVEFVEIIDKKNIKIKVWERGVGKTLACGTGACAASAVGYKKTLLEKHVNVELDGGKLSIECDENNINMIGDAEFVYEGRLNL